MGRRLETSDAETIYKDPIALLRNEHHVILQRLELIERTLQYLESLPSRTAFKRCHLAQSRLRDWTNELIPRICLHFCMEEEALFPILAEYIGKEQGPIEVMLQEHDNIKLVLSDWKRDVGELCKLTGASRNAFLKIVTDLGYKVIGLLRVHISKENQILFKICEASLSMEEKKIVAQKLKIIGTNQIKITNSS